MPQKFVTNRNLVPRVFVTLVQRSFSRSAGQGLRNLCSSPVLLVINLVPRVFVPLDQRSENESSGSNHFRHAPWMQTAQWNRIGRIIRIRLFQNGCSQSSRFPTAGQGERRLWERDWFVIGVMRLRSLFLLLAEKLRSPGRVRKGSRKEARRRSRKGSTFCL